MSAGEKFLKASLALKWKKMIFPFWLKILAGDDVQSCVLSLHISTYFSLFTSFGAMQCHLFSFDKTLFYSFGKHTQNFLTLRQECYIIIIIERTWMSFCLYRSASKRVYGILRYNQNGGRLFSLFAMILRQFYRLFIIFFPDKLIHSLFPHENWKQEIGLALIRKHLNFKLKNTECIEREVSATYTIACCRDNILHIYKQFILFLLHSTSQALASWKMKIILS